MGGRLGQRSMLWEKLMPKLKPLFLTGFLCVISICSAAKDDTDSLILLDTNKSIDAVQPKPKAKIEPKYNITNVLDKPNVETTDIYFNADSLENSSHTGLITASGNVEITREDLTLRADKVTYDQNTDHISASGNVILLEKSGNVLFADSINLSEKMQNADVENIKVILLDKTRLAARSFRKKSNDRKVMRNAVYTPCDNCQNSSPLWQIKATKVLHNPIDQNVEYQNALLEIKSVPVFYTPYFSHPDPSVKHRSGFLFPRFMSNGFLGAAVQPQYFWDISEQTNLTFNPIISTDKDPVYSAIFRTYFYRGELNASGSLMQDKDYDKKDDPRGHLFLYGRYELNDYWVADTDINYVSDHNYLDDLDLPKRDDSWLTSRLRLQAFDNRNYAYVEGYYYDMLSYRLQNFNKPYVFPTVGYENISTPNAYGAYFRNSFSGASIYHKEDDASQRLTMVNEWNLPYTSPYGEKYKMTASLKSDVYYATRYYNFQDEYYTGTTARVFPQLGLEWRLPFIRNTENTSQILEPIILGAIAPDKGNKRDKIPNDDSRYIELTDTNIFDLDRYAGYDRNDVGSRVSYGLNWSFYGKQWGRSSLLFAQNYEFKENDEIFKQNNSGSRFSDYVGRLYAAPSDFFDITYRFKLDKDDYDITYSELSSSFGNDLLRLNVGYIFFPQNDQESLYYGYRRKELYTSVRSQITRNWSVKAFTRQDLENSSTISNGGGISYEDECAKFALTAEKEYSKDPHADNDISFYFTFYLKTIGGIGNN